MDKLTEIAKITDKYVKKPTTNPHHEGTGQKLAVDQMQYSDSSDKKSRIVLALGCLFIICILCSLCLIPYFLAPKTVDLAIVNGFDYPIQVSEDGSKYYTIEPQDNYLLHTTKGTKTFKVINNSDKRDIVVDIDPTKISYKYIYIINPYSKATLIKEEQTYRDENTQSSKDQDYKYDFIWDEVSFGEYDYNFKDLPLFVALDNKNKSETVTSINIYKKPLTETVIEIEKRYGKIKSLEYLENYTKLNPNDQDAQKLYASKRST